MTKILFISSSPQKCGVHQFGKNTCKAIARSNKFQFFYFEFANNRSSSIEFLTTILQEKPDAIIYNWHEGSMPWLNEDLLQHIKKYLPKIKHLAIVHEHVAPYPTIDSFIHIDPTFIEQKSHYRVGRLIPDFEPKDPPKENIIGSFGFGGDHKNYTQVILQANAEFENARIRLHIPFSHYGDIMGEHAKKYVEECRKLAKPGITIEANHNFLEENQLLEWLAGNRINCFFFSDSIYHGISSSIEYALAARRPIAISSCSMFRHVANTNPSINIKDSSLRKIIENGMKPLESFYSQWTEKNLIKDYERILERVL